MATEIDALQLNFTASNRVAIDSIDKLSKSLATLGDRLGVFSNAGQYETPIKNLASSIDTLSNSINGIDNEKFKSLSSSLKSFFTSANKLSDFKGFSSVQSGAKGVSDEVKKMAETFAKEWGIDGKKATESLNESVGKLYSDIASGGDLRKASSDIAQLIVSFSNLTKEIKSTNSEWKQVRDYISNSNIKLPDMTSEWGDDYKRKRGILGLKNTTTSTSRSGDFAGQVAEMNSALGTTFDITKSEQDILNEIVDYLERGKQATSDLVREYWSTREASISVNQSIGELVENLTNANEKAQNFKNSLSETGQESSPFQNIVSGLTEISGVDTTNFGDISKLASGIKGLGDPSIQSVAGYLPNIANAMKTFQDVHLPSFEGFDTFVKALRSMGSSGVQNASWALPGIAESIQKLQGMDFTTNLSGITELAKSLSMFGKSSTTQAVTNIPLLATAFRNLITTLSTAPTINRSVIDLANAMANLASSGGRAGTAVNSLTGRLNFFGNTARNVSRRSFSLAGAIGKVYATYFLLFRAFGKIREAINISSDLKEVENVVYTTFGNMTNKVEEFAQTSIKKFGMSELSAKQFAARFQAMGTAMAIPAQSVANAQKQLNKINPVLNSRGYSDTADSIADMSLNLTKLTGDIASFYNVSQEDVAEDLESIYTGMTRNLRKFGLDLTENTLKEWAMKNGLDANIKSMTQAEKTLLRYQYVMANMSAVMGDYQKTSMTWSNATRTLAQNFQRLGAVIGSGFIAWLRPMVIQVNAAMDSIIAAVQKTVNALGKIFGWQMIVDTTGSSIVDDTEAIADGYDDATAAAKKFAKQLLGIDEINNLTTNDSGKGNGDDDLYGGLRGGNIIEPGGISFERFESDIDSLFELGKKISDKLKNMMDSIDWDSIYEKASNFGKGLADFLNGLIDPGTFYRIGETIGGTLNMVVYASLSFADTANWKKFGIALGNQINGFFNTFDFAALGESVDKWINGILEMLIAAVQRADWEKVGKQIGKFLSKINFGKILKNVGKLIWEGINAAFQTYATTFKTAPLETGLLTLLGLSKTTSLITVANFKTIGDTLRNALIVFDDELLLTSNRTSALNAGLKSIRSTMTPLAKGLIGVGAGFAEFFAVSDAIHDITVGTGSLAANIAELAVGVAGAGAAFTLVFGFPAGLIATGVIGLVGAFKGLYDAVNEINEINIVSSLKAEVEGVSFTFDDMTKAIQNDVKLIIGSLDGMHDKFKLIGDSKQSFEDLSEGIESIVGSLQYQNNVGSGEIDALLQKIGSLRTAWEDYINSTYDYTIAKTMADMEYLESSGKMTDSLREEYLKRIARLQDEKNTALDTAKNVTSALETQSQAYSEAVREYGADSQQAKDALTNLSNGYLEFYNQSGLVGKIFKQTNDYVGETKQGISDLIGTLDLSNESFENFDELAILFADNAKLIGDEITSAKDTVSQSIADIDEQLKTATGANKEALEASKEILAQQNKDLDELTLETADILQRNLAEKGANVIQGALDEYEKMSFGKKLGLKLFDDVTDADSYAKQQFTEFINSAILSDDGAVGQINNALGVAEEQIWIDEFVQNMSDGIFDSEYSFHTNRTYYELAEDWADVFNSALDETTGKVHSEETGKNVIGGMLKGISLGLSENIKSVSDSVADITQKTMNGSFEINSPARKMYSTGENIILGIFEGFKLVDFASKMSEWWRNNVQPWFSLDLWSGLGDNIKKGLTQGFNNAVAGMKGIWNDFANWLNGLLNFSWDAVKIAGKEIIPGGSINLGRIPTFANGGFPDQGSLFVAGETYGQSEWVGNIGGRTGVVSNDEITGIAQAIYQTSSEEMVMLRQQNQLLQGILEKDFGITESDIGRSARNYGIDYYNRTGNQAFTF